MQLKVEANVRPSVISSPAPCVSEAELTRANMERVSVGDTWQGQGSLRWTKGRRAGPDRRVPKPTHNHTTP